MKKNNKFKVNPNALPSLIDKECETKRLDSIRKNALDEIKENDRLKELAKKDKEMMNR